MLAELLVEVMFLRVNVFVKLGSLCLVHSSGSDSHPMVPPSPVLGPGDNSIVVAVHFMECGMDS